jgi:hypothetical protein
MVMHRGVQYYYRLVRVLEEELPDNDGPFQAGRTEYPWSTFALLAARLGNGATFLSAITPLAVVISCPRETNGGRAAGLDRGLGVKNARTHALRAGTLRIWETETEVGTFFDGMKAV